MHESNLPAHTITINNYHEYRDDILRFADGKYNALLVIGTTGLSKTETLKDMLAGKPLHYEGGCPTAYQLHCDAYHHQDQFILFDDLSPRFYKSHDTNSILKVLINSLPEKTMRHKSAALSATTDPPHTYKTKSKVIILANQWQTINEHIRSLEGRCFSILFQPTPSEVHHEVCRRGWFTDQEVLDFVWENRRFITVPDMRLYVKIAEQKKAGTNWRKRGLQMLIGGEKMQRVVDLLTDPTLTSNKKRAEKFIELGYGVRSTFYEILKEFKYYKPADADAEPPKAAKAKKIVRPDWDREDEDDECDDPRDE